MGRPKAPDSCTCGECRKCIRRQKKNAASLAAYHRKKSDPEWLERKRVSRRQAQIKMMRARGVKPAVVLEPEERERRKLARSLARKLKGQRPETCTLCGTKGPVEGHHPDYAEPLHVIWLCVPCHRRL